MIKLINVVNNTTNLRRLIDFFINFFACKKRFSYYQNSIFDNPSIIFNQ
ncbi:hypothetical protein AAJ76_1700051332 [Vairimorpha ceranae]|uniref:Uncharacterized protein n=1 Tax=Vairimorpha ceranae TaxID=40302 RepID=A0A0F9YSS8_9MICR|nr:hypothetical protein AAJ76_1700051332 [Vairimorpha ceranae]KKO75592.1 hypothetical protein AAJ76_1700051332 [Vairimorpha ceranae]